MEKNPENIVYHWQMKGHTKTDVNKTEVVACFSHIHVLILHINRFIEALGRAQIARLNTS
jgi:hypothetical protein